MIPGNVELSSHPILRLSVERCQAADQVSQSRILTLNLLLGILHLEQVF